jgi:AraC family transcriptional regulator
MVGETPLQLHRRLRLERAAWGLIHGDEPVTQLAFEAGYDTHEAFTRAFRERYGRPPSEFREAREQEGSACLRTYQVELAAPSGIHYAPGFSAQLNFQPIQGENGITIEIKSMEEMRVATARHVGPYPLIAEAFQRLHQLGAPAGLLRPGAKMLAIYHDDPETTPEHELRSDAAITVADGAELPAGLGEASIAGGRYACATHVGAYAGLGDAWARLLGQWLPASGERVGPGVWFEIYVNNPGDTPEPELRTELYVPLT